ncbi:sensor histidine kinase [Deinococcus maricopensis]|uniref:histidine kinase n=1 Tax=Deinococcus maricopensis (strain DSM 21211 / LMG 22137 / NRRL B-23946 / LB-34) TaxID=709986 RepID=E8U930_DEIML|nr:ATP-binding protein [Deinococcus maricopensis]ADV67569.1 PAS/PAC sensor signal transduction histidine kinase [Deinococcus maricopensis DSM 21211]
MSDDRFGLPAPPHHDAFTTLPAACFILSAQGRVQDVNPAGLALLGVTAEGVVGRAFSALIPTKSQAPVAALLARPVEGAGRQRVETQLLGPDGATLDVLLDVAAGAGDAPAWQVVATDVSAFKSAHRTLLDTTTTLDAQVQAQRVKIRALNEELEGIITSFLQQLNLPVARAVNFVSLLRKSVGDVDGVGGRALEQTERAIQAVFALSASLDRYMQGRRLRLRLRPVDLNVVLREVLKKERAAMADRKVDVVCEALPVVEGDSQALMLILEEYIANALKFTKLRETAQVHIVARETDTEYHIGVADNGAGFNMRQRDKLFRLFGRLHSTTTYEGSGIGLANVRRLCERVGGRCWAEGKVDVGATFWFAWPKRPTVLE